MAYSVGVDIGGTFTDCVVADAKGSINIFKTPSTPGEFERGFMDAFGLAADHYGQTLEEFLADVDIIVHGTTVTTNALTEGKVRRAGLIVTAGHPDILLLREAPRKRSFDWNVPYPDPFIPRQLTCEVRGRIDARGQELAPMNEEDVHAATLHLRKAEVEAIAVSLLWSIVNNSHECRVREIVREIWPDVPVTLSHELNPIPREYRRTISTAMNASVFSIVKSYISALKSRLQEAGYKRDLLVANCVGGMMPPDEIIEKPIYSVMSGPTLAPIAAVHLTSEKDVIVVDMGGTTFDVSALRNRQLVIASEAMIGKDLLGIPKVDVRSIGAGGGSMAWVDSGGLLRVGPQSAGAVPGPACYGAGGTDATVTDANVVLGIINPDYFLAGRMKLDRVAAEKAVARIADLLGISSIEAAYAIHTTCNHNMVGAIENITMNEGIDPRESYLVSGGGSTASHISEMAKVLGIKRFLIPKLSSALSAYGGLVSDVRFDEVGTLRTDQRSFAREAVTSLLNQLRQRGERFLRRAGIPDSQSYLEYSFTGRYKYQSWDIEVPFTLPTDEIQSADVDMLVAAFHSMHERIHTFKEEGDIVEFTTWKVMAIGRNGFGRRVGEQLSPAASGAVKPKAYRPIYVHELGGTEQIPVYDGNLLGAGAHLAGPCVIEEDTTTIFLLPSMVADTDQYGNYKMSIIN